MNFIPAIKSGFVNCFKFTGRASRSEFWWFYLFFVLTMMASFVLCALVVAGIETTGSASTDNDSLVGSAILGIMTLYILVMFFPTLSLIIRRLHDSDKSGFFVLLYLIPLGGLVLLVFYCLPGTKGPNPHGENPLGGPGSSSAATVARTFE